MCDVAPAFSRRYSQSPPCMTDRVISLGNIHVTTNGNPTTYLDVIFSPYLKPGKHILDACSRLYNSELKILTTRPSTTTRPEITRLQNTHARGDEQRWTLRRRQIILQRRIVESQRCSSTPTHVHLQPNYYRPRRRRARRQILSSLIRYVGPRLIVRLSVGLSVPILPLYMSEGLAYRL